MAPVLQLISDENPRKGEPLFELARTAATGDMQATAALLKQLAPGMIRSVRVLMGPSHPDVDDVVQQALIGLVQALPAFRGDCSPAHYASRIVARTAVGARLRSKVRSERRDDSVELEELSSLSPSATDAVAAERRRATVRELLQELPEAQAETLAMRVVMGFSLIETAAATEVPVNTVRSRIRLAKQALRKRIDADPVLQELLEVDE